MDHVRARGSVQGLAWHHGLVASGSLEAANLGPDDQVEVSTNGRIIVIAPVRSKRDVDKFTRGQELMHAKFAGVFRRLAR